MIAALALVITFLFPAFPPFLQASQPLPSIDGATGWKLYTWNAEHSVYCECDLEVQYFIVTGTRAGDRVTVTLPAGIKPGPRYMTLVPMFGEREGTSGATTQRVMIE